ncbi:MAG: lysophospholipid acyltransferase family protein [Candidatus Acidiferrales bacterium]
MGIEDSTEVRLYYIRVSEAAKTNLEHTGASVNSQFDTRLPELSPWRRRQIPVIAALVSGSLRAIGPTMRFESVGEYQYYAAKARSEPIIAAFWHRCIFPAIWRFRGHGIVVMNTTNFDGQWTRRVIEGLGFGTAQGSSTRGGMRGLIDMAKRLEQGLDAAFTIDGPRGPRYVAKPGPVMLARRSGKPILVFHIGVESGLTLEKTWDHFQIPQPFTRAVVVFAPPIRVSTDAGSEEMQQKQNEMQKTLERVRDIAEGWYRMPPQERARIREEFGEPPVRA